MKAKRKFRVTALLIAVILGVFVRPLYVYAADATVTFGSNWYNKKSGDTFPVGVYLKADAAIGNYYIEIKYDNLRLEYVDGADEADEENGVLVLEGNRNSREIKFWLRFKAISGGEAYVEVDYAEAVLRNSADDELFNITEYDSAPIHISGEDTAAAIEAQMEAEAERAEQAEEEQERAEAEQTGLGEGEELEDDENGDNAGIDGQGEDGAGVDADTGQGTSDGNEMGAGNLKQDMTEPGSDGNNGDDEGVSVDSDAEDGEAKQVKQGKRDYIFFNAYFVIALAIILLIVLVEMIVWVIIKSARAKRKRKEEKQKRIKEKQNRYRKASHSRIENVRQNANGLDEVELLDFDFDESETSGEAKRAKRKKELINQMNEEEYELEWQKGRPVIRVKDVTMEFRLSSVNPSGLKEYIVQLLKREVSYRRLYALYHVSFNVYKGEVIGVIGTNGSGKSTLLKIVSGALKPTSGHVEIAGRKKVQLLTIGTGFDMELTARENVFLNGSIIGYRKEFLEEHYNEIVEFAELQDFMDEKVKNFSSGMVSRLGFAIATAGDAAEILILDEILSVGDEFFRQKSLKRIKEMIHGGSTVLMVSHSMGTILENCSRCVWIEKGELQMAGDPKVVCEEYRRMNG